MGWVGGAEGGEVEGGEGGIGGGEVSDGDGMRGCWSYSFI